MNADFPRILTLLRKERGISQKEAAKELGISQALLSHYEKGIRECGLDFVVRAADFYRVSCDYLLGRSPERTGATLSVEDIPEAENGEKNNRLRGSILPTLNKKLIFNSLNILFDLLQRLNCTELTKDISDFLMLSVYRMFRIVYSVNHKNNQNFFLVPKHLSAPKAIASMVEIEANAAALADGTSNGKIISSESRESIALTSESLAASYPQYTSSLLNLIKNSEHKMNP
ncbi:MAG: helix-turn-helix domain-containing protein [Candidatus Merdivicinus sp.]|jgi:transcriptional regulator with XRE-family HTH domain